MVPIYLSFVVSFVFCFQLLISFSTSRVSRSGGAEELMRTEPAPHRLSFIPSRAYVWVPSHLQSTGSHGVGIYFCWSLF